MSSTTLKKDYTERIVPALEKEFKYTSVMQVPRLTKIVINQGLGAATQDKKVIETAINELTAITGQKAVPTLSKKDIASFKVRKRAKLVAKYAAKRAALKKIVNTGEPAEAFEAAQKLQALPKNSNPIRMHNRCSLTGRPKGYIRQFGISRIQFREMASAGLIPGVKKASW